MLILYLWSSRYSGLDDNSTVSTTLAISPMAIIPVYQPWLYVLHISSFSFRATWTWKRFSLLLLLACLFSSSCPDFSASFFSSQFQFYSLFFSFQLCLLSCLCLTRTCYSPRPFSRLVSRITHHSCVVTLRRSTLPFNCSCLSSFLRLVTVLYNISA